jgi:MFS family permease
LPDTTRAIHWPVDRTSNLLRPFRAGYFFGGFNGLTWMMTFGTPMVLLLEQLGGSTFQIGLTSSFVFTLYPLQIVATALLSRLGFQRQMVLAWSLRALFLSVPLAIAIRAPVAPEPWMTNSVVVAVFGFCFFRAFGVAAHLPWLAAILPDEVRGRFFATEGAIVSAVGVVALLTCAVLFWALTPYSAFRVVFGIAIFGSIMAIASLLRLPAGPRPGPSPVRAMLPETRRLCLEPGLFRQYLGITAVGSVVGTSFSVFTIYYLKTEADLASSTVLGFTAAQFGGQIVGSFSVRHFIDRIPLRRLMQIAQLIVASVLVYWVFILTTNSVWLVPVAFSYLVIGAALGISNTAHYTFLPELSSEAKRPVTMAIFGAVAGLLQGLGPMLWGLALRTGDASPGVHGDRFLVFFLLGIGLAVLSIWLLTSLPEVRRHAGLIATRNG